MSAPPLLDDVLDAAMHLDAQQQDLLIGVLVRRRADRRREEIAAHAWEGRRALRAGALMSKPADLLVKRLHETE